MGWQRRLQLGVSSLALIAGALATQAAYGQAQVADGLAPKPLSAEAEMTPSLDRLSPQEQLPGLWQGQIPNDGPQVQMLFQADGTMLLFHPDPSKAIALQATYAWPDVDQPNAIDLEAGGDLIKGLIEFDGKDQMRLDASTTSDEPRPDEFGAQTITVTRISLDSIDLAQIRIVSFEEWMQSL